MKLNNSHKRLHIMIAALFIATLPQNGLAQTGVDISASASSKKNTTKNKKKKKHQQSKYQTFDVDLFVTALQMQRGKIVGAQLAWLPPSMVSVCMGRTVYNCEELRYVQAYQHKKHVASITGSLEVKEKENIPPVALTEWVTEQEMRYYGQANAMFAEIEKLPAIKTVLNSFKKYDSINHSLEPLHVHYSVHATVGYEPWDIYNQFRILEISIKKF